MGGEVIDTGQGPLVVVRRDYPLTYAHGRFSLAEALEVPPSVLSTMARGEEAPAEAGTLLFLDTETTGLAGGTGTYAFLVGAGYAEGGRFVVVQHFMRDFDEEPALLAALHPLLERASGVVTFNGSGFDLPLLETRFVLARRRWPASLANLDLLHPARRVWSARYEDCRLSTLEREVLGLWRDEDVPGAMIPSLYFDFLRFRRAAPLARVFSHNRADVLSLVTLLGWFTRALGQEDSSGLDPWDLVGLGRLLERIDPERSATYYRTALDAGLDGPGAQRARLRLAYWEKRRARWETACALWEASTATECFDPHPWEELAKYHEHRRRDMTAARAVVREALDLAEGCRAPVRVLEAFTYRLARLERRLGFAGRGG